MGAHRLGRRAEAGVLTIRPRFFGRRSGKKLRRSAVELLDTLLPRLALAIPGEGEVVTPRALFPPSIESVWLEIGFGGGEHVAEQARLHPEAGIIACEVFRNGIASLLGQLPEDASVRIFPEDARLLLPALPDASIGRVFLLFPDPWPKTRHAERRFVGPQNLDELARIMADGAEFRVASDDPVYQGWALAHLRGHLAFEEILATSDRGNLPADWPATRYEVKCLAGRAPLFLIFRRRARHP